MHAVFVGVPTSGHVNPTLGVAAELVGRGHRVTYYLNDAYWEQVAATGADYRATPGLFAGEMGPPGGKFNQPLLLVPQQLEQALVAQRVVDLGAGRKAGRAGFCRVLAPDGGRDGGGRHAKGERRACRCLAAGSGRRAGGGRRDHRARVAALV